MKIRKVATVAFCALALGVPAMSGAQASSPDREAARARLERKADELRRELIGAPKLGMVEQARIRADLRSINSLSSRLEAGEAPSQTELAAVLERGSRFAVAGSQDASKRLQTRQEKLEAKLHLSPKLGVRERERVRKQIGELDELIASLERGETVDLARVDDLIGQASGPRAVTPEERRQSLEIRRASMNRQLKAGPKLGILERVRIRDEIESLDAMISELESR